MRFTAKENTVGPGWHVVDTETGRAVAWVYDHSMGRFEQDEVNEDRAKLFASAEMLRVAIIKTLDDNAHLADGENCTLIALKVALRESGFPWDGDE